MENNNQAKILNREQFEQNTIKAALIIPQQLQQTAKTHAQNHLLQIDLIYNDQLSPKNLLELKRKFEEEINRVFL